MPQKDQCKIECDFCGEVVYFDKNNVPRNYRCANCGNTFCASCQLA